MRRAWLHDGYNKQVERAFLAWMDAGEPDLLSPEGREFIVERGSNRWKDTP
jgi:hypothetical protein